MNPTIGRVSDPHREIPDFSCGSQFWIIGRVPTDLGLGLIKRPGFLNQNPLLDTASLRLVRDFVGDLRYDLRVHLPVRGLRWRPRFRFGSRSMKPCCSPARSAFSSTLGDTSFRRVLRLSDVDAKRWLVGPDIPYSL